MRIKRKLRNVYAAFHYYVMGLLFKKIRDMETYVKFECQVCGREFWTIEKWGIDPTIGIMCEDCYVKYLKTYTPEKSFQMFLDWFLPRCAEDIEYFKAVGLDE